MLLIKGTWKNGIIEKENEENDNKDQNLENKSLMVTDSDDEVIFVQVIKPPNFSVNKTSKRSLKFSPKFKFLKNKILINN